MFYDNLKKACDARGLKLTPIVVECCGNSGSISGWKKGAMPNSKIVVALAARLNVSTDYLLLGSDAAASIVMLPTRQLNEHDTELLDLFHALDPIEQGRLLGQLQERVDARRQEQHKPDHKVG